MNNGSLKPRFCGACSHWERQIDAHNIAGPQTGHCKAGPPQLVVVPTQQGPALMAQYPPLPHEFPACGQWAPRLALGLGRLSALPPSHADGAGGAGEK